MKKKLKTVLMMYYKTKQIDEFGVLVEYNSKRILTPRVEQKDNEVEVPGEKI